MSALNWLEHLTDLNYRLAQKLSEQNGFKAYRLEDHYLGMDGIPIPEKFRDIACIGLYVDENEKVISYRVHNKDKVQENARTLSDEHTQQIQNNEWQEKLVGMTFKKARMWSAHHGYFAYYVAPEYLNQDSAPVPKVYTDSPMIGLVVNKDMQVIGHTAKKKAVPVLVN